MASETTRYWNIDRIMWLILSIAGAVLLIWLINYLRNALLPFFAACFVAYLLQPVVEFNRRWTHLKGRAIASILTVIEVTLVFVLFVWFLLPSAIEQFSQMGAVMHAISTGRIKLPPEYMSIVNFVNKYLDPSYISSLLSEIRLETILRKGSSLLEESAEVIVHTVSWLLTLIYVLFILIDYPQIVRGFKLIIPEKYRDRAMKLVKEVEQSMNHYFRGQGVVALCAMVLYCIGFSIVGLPLAIPMGILVGILYMIPYFQYITLIPVAILCFISSLTGEVTFIAMMGKSVLVYVVSQCICDYVITPHIMGKELGLNPAIILISLSVWGSLLGIIGMIIALPATALMMTYYEMYISNRK